MLNNTAIKNNLKRKDVDQLDNIIETWYMQWMIKLKQYAQRLIEKNIIDESSVSWLFNQKNNLN
jgi:Tfp pilus assembly pilus retraction ATPase PilT